MLLYLLSIPRDTHMKGYNWNKERKKKEIEVRERKADPKEKQNKPKKILMRKKREKGEGVLQFKKEGERICNSKYIDNKMEK